MSSIVSFFSRTYYDRSATSQCYVNVITLDVMPAGPLAAFARRISFPPLSAFGEGPNPAVDGCACGIVLLKPPGACTSSSSSLHYATLDDMSHVYRFLLSNGYQIETQITHMIQGSGEPIAPTSLICMATYYPSQTPNITYMR